MARFGRRRWLANALAASTLLLAPGCLAPTLPLPPPSRPDVEGPTPAGTVILSGRTQGNVEVIATNLRTQSIGGQITGADGAYRFEMEAEAGDLFTMRYRIGTEDSPAIEFRIPEPD